MYLQVILASVAGGVLSLAGGALLLWREGLARKFSLNLLSFAAGSMIGAAFLELIPESMEISEYSKVGTLVVIGILAMFLFEKSITWYHCHDRENCNIHTFSGPVILGDTIHNFVDGIAIALSFAAGSAVGIATTIAIFFHEVPQEIGDFGVLLHAGYSKKKVLFYNFLSACASILGAVLGLLLLPYIEPALGLCLAFAAGVFIYVAISDLLPELRHEAPHGDIVHILALILGVVMVWAVGVFFHE